ncbi:hypothetical protein ABID19_001215 [Mesorhizobium robiniae]|uniref:Uncharacterized protein n=1 Tax=Mesorhizobium robiniae TaxID=559315 RepID=A0ABV2GIX3_9HYPH
MDLPEASNAILAALGSAWVQFASDTFSTLIGVMAGFAVSIYLSRKQIQYDSRKDQETVIQVGISNLKQVVYACASNLENLLNMKYQMIGDLKSDCDKVRPAINEFRDPKEIVAISEPLRTFFVGFPRLGVMKFPDYDKFSEFINDIPMLLSIIHKTEFTLEDLNNRIASRNSLIDKHSMKNMDGLNAHAVFYFHQMILSESDNIIQYVDDALFFSDLLSEQLINYMKCKYPEQRNIKFAPSDHLKAIMPPKDYVKTYRDQFRDFSTMPKKKKLFTLADAFSKQSL